MKQTKVLMLCLMVLFAFTACKNEGGKVLKKGNGPQPKVGDVVFYEMIVYKDTAEIFNTLKTGQTAQDIIIDPVKMKSGDATYHFLTKSLLSMKKGDSTEFVMKLDTFKQKPAGLESAKSARFIISLTNVMSESEYVATLRPEQKEAFMMQKKQMAIAERVESVREDMKKLQTQYDSSKDLFIGRSKTVADSMKVFAKDFSAGKLPSNIQSLPSGLRFAVIKEGTGKQVNDNDFAYVHYYGCLKTGVKFDESFERGEPFVFPVGVGQVIPGWDEGVKQLKEGSTAVLYVPASLGYGDRPAGAIPPNSELVFYIEVLKAL